MDCFYASVEMREHPEWHNKPIAVGGTGRRGVLTTANYPARAYGVRSAQPTWKALDLCPHLILVRPRFEVYTEVSKQIREIFHRHTQLIQPLSLDEAFLDVTDSTSTATRIAHTIRKQIHDELDLNASAGIAPNKMLAKIASDWHKPNGQFTISPQDVDAFMKGLPIQKIWGIGPKTAKWMQHHGIHTCGDLQAVDLAMLIQRFGKYGNDLYNMCRGIDERPVNPDRARKSASTERTLSENCTEVEILAGILADLHAEFFDDMQNKSYFERANKAFLKLKFSDFSKTSIETTGSDFSLEHYQSLLQQAFHRNPLPVRLIGIGIRLDDKAAVHHQLDFFDTFLHD